VHHRTTLSGYISATKARINNQKKDLLSSNISPTCPYNMVNFGPLAAEIVSLVWGTPANFNGFGVLVALLHSQTAALNRGRHLYSAGRPSRWALAHISSCVYFVHLLCAREVDDADDEEEFSITYSFCWRRHARVVHVVTVAIGLSKATAAPPVVYKSGL